MIDMENNTYAGTWYVSSVVGRQFIEEAYLEKMFQVHSKLEDLALLDDNHRIELDMIFEIFKVRPTTRHHHTRCREQLPVTAWDLPL